MPSLVEIEIVFMEKQSFKCRQCIFAISKLSALGKRAALYLNKFEFLSPKVLCAKFGYNWPSGS